MDNLDICISSNHHLLKQLTQQLTKLQTISPNIYSAEVPIIGGASIGAHLRHILDFYQALISGIKTGVVDYDDRQRGTKVERCLNAGLLKLDDIMQMLNTHCLDIRQSIKVCAAVDTTSNSELLSSNLARELQTLHSHTTHHMAIIAIVLKLNNCQVEDNFGKAPSTIRYEQQVLPATASSSSIETTFA